MFVKRGASWGLNERCLVLVLGCSDGRGEGTQTMRCVGAILFFRLEVPAVSSETFMGLSAHHTAHETKKGGNIKGGDCVCVREREREKERRREGERTHQQCLQDPGWR